MTGYGSESLAFTFFDSPPWTPRKTTKSSVVILVMTGKFYPSGWNLMLISDHNRQPYVPVARLPREPRIPRLGRPIESAVNVASVTGMTASDTIIRAAIDDGSGATNGAVPNDKVCPASMWLLSELMDTKTVR